MIKRFIIWYLKRHNATIRYKGYVVRMFTVRYYDNIINKCGLASVQSKYQKEL